MKNISKILLFMIFAMNIGFSEIHSSGAINGQQIWDSLNSIITTWANANNIYNSATSYLSRFPLTPINIAPSTQALAQLQTSIKALETILNTVPAS